MKFLNPLSPAWMGCLFLTALPALLVGGAESLGAAEVLDRGRETYETMRSLFYREAGLAWRSDEEKALYFSYEQGMIEALSDAAATGGLEDADQAIVAGKASNLLRAAVAPMALEAAPSGDSVPLIVIFPGIFGEFIQRYPFDEVFTAPNRFGREWEAMDTGSDLVFSLEKMGDIEVPLRDLVMAASIEIEGKVAARLLFLKPPLLSLETLGSLEDNSSYYLRRLDKALGKAGWQGHPIYFMGYSRGAAVALDVLSRLQRSAQAPLWAGNVKGVVSLVGTLWGSHLADDALDPGSSVGSLLGGLRQGAAELQPVSGGIAAGAGTVKENLEKIFSILKAMQSSAASAPVHESLQWENLGGTAIPDAGLLASVVSKALLDNFKLQNFISEYNQNIERFKLVVERVFEAVETLSTPSRVEWWKRNALPPGLRYFSISATMGDPTLSPGTYWGLSENPLAVAPGSVDYRLLRKSFYDLMRLSGVGLNDSQMALSRTFFLPELHRRLNASQLPYDAQAVALLGASHWAVTLAQAVEPPGSRNPFPRTALMRALALLLSKLDSEGVPAEGEPMNVRP